MNLHEQICEWENLRRAYANASRGKRGRGATALFESLLADNLLELEQELREQTYQPGKYSNFYIHEPKKRLISAAPFRDRVIHHALCNVTQPHFERLFIADSYANRVGKGTHRAIDRCQQFARKYQYVLQCDIAQFFPSIDHALLRETLKSMLPDESALWLIDRILASGQGVLAGEYDMVYFPNDDLLAMDRPRGLPIGNLTSQLWANCYMNSFDHCVRRELGCAAYLRYVDDFLLFGDDKSEIMNWRDVIVVRLEKLRLTLHKGSAHPRPVSAGISFLGFRIFPDYRRVKQRKGFAFRRKLRHLLRSAGRETVRASVQGWINHVRYADTFHLRQSMLKEFDLLYV
ncbi:MAG: RNA-dependent DNA polymerase [Anaerolineae bacterium]|nr:RNA-dependent DNA polymerase [Chloroflexi bacterium CFX1]MCQ3947428.1 RNA-dependent DNA polymerase [Anaerolineae bacterium]RIK26738.1 MAG: RNA-dependent DNA polymerase [Anaerolineae bacterium]